MFIIGTMFMFLATFLSSFFSTSFLTFRHLLSFFTLSLFFGVTSISSSLVSYATFECSFLRFILFTFWTFFCFTRLTLTHSGDDDVAEGSQSEPLLYEVSS